MACFAAPTISAAPCRPRGVRFASARRTLGIHSTRTGIRGVYSISAVSEVTGQQSTAQPSRFSQSSFEELLLDIQENLCKEGEQRDGSGRTFCFDKWERQAGNPAAGYGITRVLEGGNLLEKAAANVSIIRGQLTEVRAKAMSARLRANKQEEVKVGDDYFAAALSLVFHSAHPHIPTLRADIRYFEVEGQQGWFGGGVDLTPFYLVPEDATSFHRYCKSLCDKYHPCLYPHSKALCDSYFYIPARKEHRGIGGLFFDDLTAIPPPESSLHNPAPPESCPSCASKSPHAEQQLPLDASAFDRAYEFTSELGRNFTTPWYPIVESRRSVPVQEHERQWQLVRRGRYLEFNLLYDRGVRFGMDGGGRVESIMISAPPLIAWKYNVEPKEGSPEADLVEVLRSPRDWA